MAYVIPEAKPTIVQGKNGNYTLPAMSMLSSDDLHILLSITPETDTHEKVKICNEFLFKVAPELKDEGLGEWGYFEIYRAYEKEQKPEK